MSVATATLVYGIYVNALPSVADIRAGDVGNADIAGSEKLAAWASAGTVAAISLIAKDPTIFIIGGATMLLLSWAHRHANLVNPLTGKASAAMGQDATAGMDAQSDAQQPATVY
jgi:hypothetical protein